MYTRVRLVTGPVLAGLLICGSLTSGMATIHAAKNTKHTRPAQSQVHSAAKAKGVAFTGYLASAPTMSVSTSSPTTTTVPISATLTVNTAHGSVTVNVTAKTRFARRFNGASSLDELSVNDHLQVAGRRVDAQTVDASMIKDLSIENTDTLLFAKVTGVAPTALTVVSEPRGHHHLALAAGQTFTLPISPTTTIVVSGVVKPDDSSIQVGDSVSAAGVFDRHSHTFVSTRRVVDHGANKGEDEETTTTTSTTSILTTTGTTTSTTTTSATTSTTTTTGTTTTGTTTTGTTTTGTAGVLGLSLNVSGRIAQVTPPAAGSTTTTVLLWLHGNKYVSLPVSAATAITVGASATAGAVSDLAVGKSITAIAVYDAASRTFTSVTSIHVQG
jgi:hypothetical protein